MSIAENLVLASRRGKARGLGVAVNRRSTAELRDRIRPLNMGLEDRLHNPIGSLSGGQRQALTLLMASWLKPELLLLDEHTAALDPKVADQVIRLSARNYRARQAHHAHGHAFHAAGREPRPAHRDDAQGAESCTTWKAASAPACAPKTFCAALTTCAARAARRRGVAEMLSASYV